MHDQRYRYSHLKRNHIKLSSPTLSKLCLPCISTRRHINHSSKRKTPKRNHYRIVANVNHENNTVESLQQCDFVSRSFDAKATTALSLIPKCDLPKETNNNNIHQQGQSITEISNQNNKKTEENHNETSLSNVESKLTSSKLVEKDLLIASLSTNELTRLHDDNDDLVCIGIYL